MTAPENERVGLSAEEAALLAGKLRHEAHDPDESTLIEAALSVDSEPWHTPVCGRSGPPLYNG